MILRKYLVLVSHDHPVHYCDVIMGAIASQITSLTIFYLTIHSGADQRKHQSSASLAFFAENSPVTGKFPVQMDNNAENVSIWWRHQWCGCQSLFSMCCLRCKAYAGGTEHCAWNVFSHSLKSCSHDLRSGTEHGLPCVWLYQPLWDN